jgi:hypothetical protein
VHAHPYAGAKIAEDGDAGLLLDRGEDVTHIRVLQMDRELPLVDHDVKRQLCHCPMGAMPQPRDQHHA